MIFTEELKSLASQVLEQYNHEQMPDVESFTADLCSWIQEALLLNS